MRGLGPPAFLNSAQPPFPAPRIPCFKLAGKFGRKDMVKLFLKSRRSGFYFRVTQEGEFGAGDAIEELERDAAGISITDFLAIYVGEVKEQAALEKVAALEALPESWRGWVQHKLGR